MNCEWSPWSQCTSTVDPSTACGPGKKLRTYAIGAKDGGQPCVGSATALCDLEPCCKLDYLGLWFTKIGTKNMKK